MKKTCYWAHRCGVYKRWKKFDNFKCRECERNLRKKFTRWEMDHFEDIGEKIEERCHEN